MKKLAIITTHPIQYYAPVFKLLNQRGNINIKVFYTWGETALQNYDPGFNKEVSWDIPLLNGYVYEWVKNTSPQPGSDHYKGIINPGLSKQVLRWNPDAAFVIGWAYSGHLNAIKNLSKKIPVYFRGDSTLLNEPSGIKKTLKYLFLKWVYKHCSCAFFVGTNNKLYFKKYGMKENQLFFAPHAIDNQRFMLPQQAGASELRTTLGIDSTEILILYAGKFDPVKNLPLLLKAFIRLNKNNVHLLLAGSGIEEDKLKKIAWEYNGSENIHFTGFKNQSYMPLLYQAADLVCLPSKSESWGLAVNEAMACKKAVLVSDNVGCAADLVKENYNGSIFKSNDENDLVKHLALLTKSKALLKEYGENSGKMIKDWNFTKIAEAIENKLLHEKN